MTAKSDRGPTQLAHWSDEKLVQACIQNSEEAWIALIEKYKRLIYSIPIKYGLSREDANEIFQQVCAGLVSELPKLRDPAALPGWLVRVTANKCFHWGRVSHRLQPLPELETESEPVATPSLPDELLLEVEREQIVRETMSHIAPRCRELIQMLFYQDPPIPYEEAARRLGLATGSIGFIRMRCLRQLRRLLEAKGFR